MPLSATIRGSSRPQRSLAQRCRRVAAAATLAVGVPAAALAVVPAAFAAARAVVPRQLQPGVLTTARPRVQVRCAPSLVQEPPAATLSERSLQAQLRGLFGAAVVSVAPEADPQAKVAIADPRFGDYQCNDAMSLFKQQKREEGLPPMWKRPQEVGEALKAALPKEAEEMIESVNVAPQGFVTIKLRQDWMEDRVRDILRDGLRLRTESPQRIVLDYSSPNIAKEMHVGHLRSTILGDTAATLLERLGHDVVRLNHVGDWGTQFGMLLEYMRKQGGITEDGEAGELVIGDLMQFYRSAKVEFDKDPDFKAASQGNVVALQSGEPWAQEAWRRICEASRVEFQEIYSRLDIRSLEERGESFYNEMLPTVVGQLGELGLVQEDNGAKCVFTNVSEAPLIVQKADGGYGYDSTDCAAVLHRLKEERADRVIYVIDNGQESHMRMVFEVAERAGWLQGKRLDFMGFGLVQGEDGKKFKTRSGDTVRLRDLLDEASTRAEAELRSRAEERGAEFSPEQEEKLRANAEIIGVAAVKYFDLRQNRNSDYRFSYNAMLDPKGNTAVYALYAYARMATILQKSEREVASLDLSKLKLDAPSERALALRLLRFAEVIAQVEDDLLPSRLIDYAYGVATDFTTFYTECVVLGSDEETSRLALVEATRRVLQECLGILGIRPLDQL